MRFDSCHSNTVWVEEGFSNEDALWYESPEEMKKRFDDAEFAVEFAKDMIAISPDVLTKRQQEQLKLFIKGYSYADIAKKFGITRSAVHHTFHGRKVAQRDGSKKHYAGVFERLFQAILEDEKLRGKYEKFIGR